MAYTPPPDPLDELRPYLSGNPGFLSPSAMRGNRDPVGTEGSLVQSGPRFRSADIDQFWQNADSEKDAAFQLAKQECDPGKPDRNSPCFEQCTDLGACVDCCKQQHLDRLSRGQEPGASGKLYARCRNGCYGGAPSRSPFIPGR